MDEPSVPGEEDFRAPDDGKAGMEWDSGVPAMPMDSEMAEAGYPGAVEMGGIQKPKLSNTLPFHGNPNTMNLNPLILNNIQSSHYFKGS